MFQKYCTFAPSNKNDDRRSLILGYGVMVTQQILVLFFLVRVRVAQQKEVWYHTSFLLSVDTCPFQSGYTDWHYLLTFFFPVR